MSDTYQWRRKFIELVEGVFRELGFSPPAMTHDAEVPLAMELEVDGTVFEVVHSSTERPEEILVECHFGRAPGDGTAAVLARLLQVNLSLARAHEPAFGADHVSNDVIYAFHEPLDETTAPELMEIMKQTAVQAKAWQASYFFDGEDGPATPAGPRFETLA
ncbi:MAG: dapA [Herminiimonas sp.]|nr:dapA [Herminiimonas sp.]